MSEKEPPNNVRATTAAAAVLPLPLPLPLPPYQASPKENPTSNQSMSPVLAGLAGSGDENIPNPLRFTGEGGTSAPKTPDAPSLSTGVPTISIPVPLLRSVARAPTPPTPAQANATALPRASSPAPSSVTTSPNSPPTPLYVPPLLAATADAPSPEESLLSLHNEARQAREILMNLNILFRFVCNGGSVDAGMLR